MYQKRLIFLSDSNMKNIGILLLALSICTLSCVNRQEIYPKAAPGIWRAVLEFDPIHYAAKNKKDVLLVHDNFLEGQLPFNFELIYPKGSPDFYVEIHNGAERIRCDSVAWGRDRRTAMDTLRIYFPIYQSYIAAKIRGELMEGEWVVTTKKDYSIPFKAKMGIDYRFTNLNDTPEGDLTGQWAASFGDEHEPAIAEFKQEGNHLEGTFRTETGDYRYLEGTVQGDKFWLSTFDGAHAFLFSGKMRGDSLIGEFRSGTHYRTYWSAVRDADFALRDSKAISKVQAGASPIRFSIQTPDGRTLEFPSERFEGKNKIFTIAGTWCPNCYDEQRFLKQYLENHPDIAAQTEVVSFFFERGDDKEKINKHLLKYKKEMELPWEVVYAGTASKTEAQKVFPALDQVISFPTMMILDKDNTIRQIHTGFNGPATSKYAPFVQEFEAFMETL